MMDGVNAVASHLAHQKKLEHLMKFRRFYAPKQDFSTYNFELEDICSGRKIKEKFLLKNRNYPQIVDVDDF